MRREVDHLREAVDSHREIGIATGLLASSYGCTTEQAWQLLVRISQATNIKVRQIAKALQDSFDGVPLSSQQTEVLAAVVALLPPGGRPRQTRSTPRR